VLCLVQVVDDDGAGLERHKIDLACSFLVRLRSGSGPESRRIKGGSR
jgi:hypothetical protein